MRVAVVGGGIAGLAAALRLRERIGPGAEITIFEQQDRLGGKLYTGSLAGLAAERGADAFLVRDPAGDGESAAVALARRVGLGGALVHPAQIPAGLLVDGQLQPMPAGTLLGIPADPAQVARVATVPAGLDRDTGAPVLAAGQDLTVGQLVRRRFGDQLVDRLVDPLLGGVYAGRADDLSLVATMPGLAAACTTATTLAGAVAAAQAAARRPASEPATRPAGERPVPRPVFASLRGGLSRLVEAVAAGSGAGLRLAAPVRQLRCDPGGWTLTTGSTRDPRLDRADAVVLAVPARPAARLLTEVAPAAAQAIGGLDYASVALVTLALPAPLTLPEWSGFLVPAGEGLAIKAATFLTRKWPHLADSSPGAPVLIRASVGRYGEPGPLALTDQALTRQVHAELSRALGASLPPPVASQVRRWGGALPQYAPGHAERVASARAGLPRTLRLAGAGYDGVGIPACVRSGETAADQLAGVLEESVA